MPNPTPTEPKPMMRRRGLNDWLTQHGFTIGQIDNLIEDGVIPKVHLGLSGGESKVRRAYYRRDEIAQKLGIPVPSQQPITTTQTPHAHS